MGLRTHSKLKWIHPGWHCPGQLGRAERQRTVTDLQRWRQSSNRARGAGPSSDPEKRQLDSNWNPLYQDL